jgi:enterochelin esterase-like enzyme
VEVIGPFDLGFGPSRQRLVRVYDPAPLAADAKDAGGRPLLLMFDGQNIFEDEPSYAGGWHVHREVERLARTVVRPVVVAVDHGHEHRMNELSPFPMGGHSGELLRFLHFIITDLLPKLTPRYGLSTDPAHRVVGGASLGGLAALYSVLRFPNQFGGAIAMSPSLWVQRGAFFKWVEGHPPPPGRRIYLDAGAKEARGSMLRNAKRLGVMLLASGNVQLHFRADPRGQHREADWRRRLLPALRFHFGKSR